MQPKEKGKKGKKGKGKGKWSKDGKGDGKDHFSNAASESSSATASQQKPNCRIDFLHYAQIFPASLRLRERKRFLTMFLNLSQNRSTWQRLRVRRLTSRIH